MGSSIENLTKLGTLIDDNIGSYKNHFISSPSSLSISLDKNDLWPKIKIFERKRFLIE